MLDFFKNASEYLIGGKKYWASNIFHFTDMINAVSILSKKTILSRKLATESHQMYNDNASKDVISHTDERVYDYVRFYFRPLTPTQYINEGFKPGSPKDQHCPSPIFFLFDLKILSQYKNSCLVSEKSLSLSNSFSGASNNINSINNFPYQKIYSSSSYDPITNFDIKHYRQAEFVVKDKVDLVNLKWIVTRSLAEKQTLLYWLHTKNIYNYDKIIICDYEQNFQYMFYKKRLYIDNVVLADDFLTVDIANKHMIDSYKLEYKIKYDGLDVENIILDKNYTYYIPTKKYKQKYNFLIIVDGEKRYSNEFIKKDNSIF